MRADLHLHSKFSDAVFMPEEIASIAKNNGVDLISLTDHDTMLGMESMRKSCVDYGIKLVEGMEISAFDTTTIHVLGYNMNTDCQAYKQFSKWVYDGSVERISDSLSKLEKIGVYISLEEVESVRISPLIPLHNTFVSMAGVKKGYAQTVQQFYRRYLALGTDTRSNIMRLTPVQAVELVVACGGFPVLAHPGRIECEAEQRIALIKKLKDVGLGGIEVYYSEHTMEETAYYKEIATKFKLLCTGGSDTHAPVGKRRIGTPEFYPSEELLTALKVH